MRLALEQVRRQGLAARLRQLAPGAYITESRSHETRRAAMASLLILQVSAHCGTC
jgi:hypothetical protein